MPVEGTRFTVFRVGSGTDRTPIFIGRSGSITGARRKAKSYLRSLYPRLPTREGTEFDIWTVIKDRGRVVEEILPGHGAKYPFIGRSRETVTTVLDEEVYFRKDRALASLKDDRR